MSSEFHTDFDWSSGFTWIAYGDQRVARIQAPRLHDLVLSPGGDPLVSSLTLFWWQYANNEAPGRSAWLVDSVDIDDRDPACFHLELRTHNQDRAVSSHTALTLTFDETKHSFIYDVQTSLEVQPGKQWIVEPQGGVEFANPWYRGAVGSAAEFPGSTPPRWQWILYPHSNGGITRLPLNHLGSPALERIQFPSSGGWVGFFNHPGGNPVIELDAETAKNTRAEICAWGYDLHCIHRLQPNEAHLDDPEELSTTYPPILMRAGEKLSAHYRLYSLPPGEGKRLWDQAAMPPMPNREVERLTRPAFTAPACTFQTGIDPRQPDSAWYWSASHPDGVIWERGFGRQDLASLKVENLAERLAYWEVPLGPDFWLAPLPAGRLRVHIWIRTEKVSGEGAFVSFRYSNYRMETGQQPRLDAGSSEPLRGDRDWQRVELVIDPPPPGATRAYLRLALKGKGVVWFDDLLIEPAG